MSTIANYQIVTKVYESANSMVYRALAHADEGSVILKVLKKDYPNPSELTRYKQEYEITRSIEIKGAIAAYDLFPYENSLAIVLEDFGAQSLDMWLKSRLFTILEFLHIAIQLAEALTGIHGANIIHKDINPSNILFNPETGQTKIIDFGISSLFTKEAPVLKNPDILEGTLAYMSPEQTGRMNRSLDYRTDLYSLGATFYTILTKRLVFEVRDPLELVHCHIARQPIAPHEINPSIPKTLSRIVMKLLAKTAEERYQSALGLKADLEECREQWQQTGQIGEFTLAQHDLTEQFQIPQKLYGREPEIEVLLSTFQRIVEPKSQESSRESEVSRKRSEVALVGGYSGIGKTSLIQELYKPIAQQHGYFIAGKFDQFQRNIPYSAVVAAFQSLARQLLSESPARLAQWREKLLAALGSSGQVIIDVIPEIQQIVGPQPPVQSLESSEAKNRFNRIFQNFVGVFCQRSHPLVIFLDDLQWADSASLQLIELIMTDSQTEYLLLLGAYRDNEVNPHHPAMLCVDRLKEQNTIVNSIILKPLDLEEIAQLLVDALYSDRATVQALAELVLQKTSGNPFFINEFLRTIYQENLLTLDRDRRCWQWDANRVRTAGITDNVVDLMLGKLKKLTQKTQILLRLAACVGNRFDLGTLSIIHEKPAVEVFQELLPAIQMGFIQPTSELETTSEDPLESDLVIQNYVFRHDRIQQAAYALIDPEQRKAIHLKISKLLLAGLEESEREEQLFTLVDHLNKGIDLIIDTDEQIKLVELNLHAGKKAKKAVAHLAAREYLRVASSKFPGDIWQTRYEIAVDLYRELAEVEYINGDFEKSQSLIEMALDRVQTDLDAIIFYLLQIRELNMLGRYKEALVVGRPALKRLEADLPEGDLPAAFEKELVKCAEVLGDREIKALYDNPEMSSPRKKAEFKLLHNILTSAWSTSPDLTNVIISKMANINIEYGHTSFCPVAYVFFAIINTHALSKYRVGYEYSSLGLRLSDKYGNLSSKGIGLSYHGNMMMPWLRHIKQSEKVNVEAFNTCLEAGDIEFAGYSKPYNLYNLIYQGKTLETLLKEVSRSLQFSQKTRNQWAIDCLLAAKIILTNLVGETQNKHCFDLEDVAEEEFIAACGNERTPAALCFYQIFKAHVLYLYEQPIPLTVFEESAKLFGYIPATISISKHNFYYSLALIAHYPEASPEERQEYNQKLEANQKRMQDWADRCPENFLHKYLLVAAEMARISSKWQEAIELYDRAIESAKEYEFIHNEALGNELAAKFWLSRGKEDFAKLYMNKARQGYQLWGAKRKVEDLEEKYSQWFFAPSSKKDVATASTIATTSGRASKSLDIETVIKASETLSKEIVLKNLLANLMKIAIENAGAQKGFLILEKEGNWFIEAEGNINENETKLLQSIPIETQEQTTSLLASSIVNYVTHLKENVILDDACQEGDFINDPYIVATRAKSILCTPLINQGKLSGILYLENNLTANTFTSDRVELLQTLSAQAAISIENARLYEQLEDYNRTLEQKVEERTAELLQTVKVLEKTQAELKLENELLKSDEEADSFDYQIGGSLTVDSPTYVVRSADRHLYQAMRSGEFCYTFNARQMGKSSLMVRIMNGLKQDGYRCIAIDLTAIGGENTTPDQWYKGIAVEIWRKFGLLRKFKLKPWWSELTDIPAPQRLMQFIEEVVLTEVKQEDSNEPAKIVIFIDEIDCILSLNFPVNDFFALIRFCYNQRAIDSNYQRLTFAFFGATTPSTLIADPQKTPFNIGRPIHLEGFKVNEAQPLLYGLTVDNPQTILKEIIDWTGGQPFLTQKVCKFIRNAQAGIPLNGEGQWIASLVQDNILKNWESKDDPEHLKTIRDRILNSDRREQLLTLYQQVLRPEETPATYSKVEQELLLSGLAIARDGILKVNNRIYHSIFDRNWAEKQLSIDLSKN